MLSKGSALSAKGISAAVPDAERRLCACGLWRDRRVAQMPACRVSVIGDPAMPC